MNKYIDAEKLIAEIKRLKDKYPSWQLKLAMDDLSDFITTLQQEQTEVNLEKEIDSFFPESYFETAINFDDVVNMARHFYELGKTARKEK